MFRLLNSQVADDIFEEHDAPTRNAIDSTTDGCHLTCKIDRNMRSYFRPAPLRLGFFKLLGSGFVIGVSQKDRDPFGLQTATTAH